VVVGAGLVVVVVLVTVVLVVLAVLELAAVVTGTPKELKVDAGDLPVRRKS
jgi:hypothetical protein